MYLQVSESWFTLYLFLFFGAYGQDALDYLVEGGTAQKWWSDQRMWLIRSLSSYLFGLIEFLTKSLGISKFGFNLTSKVINEEESRRYEQGRFEFGIHSPLFVAFTMAAMTNIVALVSGLIYVLGSKNGFEKYFMQLLVATFAVVNCYPIYEAIIFQSKRRGIHTTTILLSAILTSALFAVAFITLKG